MTPDFTLWDQLLRRYVDAQGRVDYGAWKAEQYEALDLWIRSMESIDLASDLDTQLAFWINLYNALTIRQVLERYPISSIRPSFLGIPNWIAFLRFFETQIFTLGEERYSLNRIEHGVLRGKYKEPRIHFALVCASIGCPLLRSQAYQPDQIQDQLNEDVRRFINNPDKVRLDSGSDSRSKILHCSKIFKWYRRDFLSVSPSVQDYIYYYRDQVLPAIRAITPIRYLPYDWSLNQRTCS